MELITIVEIDQPSCQHTYGVAPCAAVLGTSGNAKCYNTHATCQNRANYSEGSDIVLRFVNEMENLPKDIQWLPLLSSASTRPVELNIVGSDPGSSPLGKRARLTASLKDAPYHDRLVDKYWAERISGAAQADGIGYDPAQYGTFWSKWQARNPIHANYNVRIRRGYVGQSLSAMRTEHYLLERIDGPASRGGVTLSAKDMLRLADDENAKWPLPNSGVTTAEITQGATTPFNITLLPAGVGDAEYNTIGAIRIGKELMTFTRAGDVMTVWARAWYNTTAAQQDAGSTVQQCVVYDDTPFIDAVYDALTLGGGIDGGSYIDFPAWQDEFDQWASSYLLNGVVTEPTGVTKLVGEILRDCIAYVWWEPSEQLIKLRALRPQEPVRNLNDTLNILADSFGQVEKPDERITSLVFCYGMINPVEKADTASNFRRARVFLPPEDRPPGDTDERIKVIYSRFLSTANESEVLVSGLRIIDRYYKTPRRIVIGLDKRDYTGGIGLAEVITLNHDLIHDATGRPQEALLQIIAVEQSADGSEFELTCMAYDFAGAYFYITADDAPSYADATPAELAANGYITQDDGYNIDGSRGDQIV